MHGVTHAGTRVHMYPQSRSKCLAEQYLPLPHLTHADIFFSILFYSISYNNGGQNPVNRFHIPLTS